MPNGKFDPLTVLLFVGVFLSSGGLVLAYHFYPEMSPLVRGYIDSIAAAFAISFFTRVGYHFVVPGQPSGSAVPQIPAPPGTSAASMGPGMGPPIDVTRSVPKPPVIPKP
jgi:hypothetical protein